MTFNNGDITQSISITQEMKDCTVTEGKAAKFVCYALGDVSTVVLWYKNEEEIQESRHYSLLVEYDACMDENNNKQAIDNHNNNSSNNYNGTDKNNKYVLVITRSTNDFEGRYTCKLSNTTMQVKSSATLRVVSQQEEDHTTEPESPECIVVQKEPVSNRFTLMDVIGRGKFGVVHKCYDNTTKCEYAAKICKCRTTSQRVMNENEISILNSLHHPLIIQLIAAFEHGRQFVQVLELVSGGELFERLSEDDLIAETDVIYYVEQMLRAVNYMHKQKILHLDLKPENILLVSKDSTTIKIIDFSLSCRMQENEYTKTLGGTRLFNPPEIIGYDPVSPASDMWSIGVIAYVLLAGFHPFEGDTDADISSNIVSCSWTCDDPVFEDVSLEAKDFIGGLLIKCPDERLTSDECLQHAWIRSVQGTEFTKKKIRTEKLVSFIARRNWKKSIAAIQAACTLKKVTSGKYNGAMNDTDDPKSRDHIEEDVPDSGQIKDQVAQQSDTTADSNGHEKITDCVIEETHGDENSQTSEHIAEVDQISSDNMVSSDDNGLCTEGNCKANGSNTNTQSLNVISSEDKKQEEYQDSLNCQLDDQENEVQAVIYPDEDNPSSDNVCNAAPRKSEMAIDVVDEERKPCTEISNDNSHTLKIERDGEFTNSDFVELSSDGLVKTPDQYGEENQSEKDGVCSRLKVCQLI